MNELKIRGNDIHLVKQKLEGMIVIQIKSTAESNHVTDYLKLLVKLV